MKTIQKQMKTYISFKHGQHDPKKRYALYMRFLCVSIFFKKILGQYIDILYQAKVNFTRKKPSKVKHQKKLKSLDFETQGNGAGEN